LKNVLERALIFGKTRGEVLGMDDLPENVQAYLTGAPQGASKLRTLVDLERETIAATLEATHYKIAKTAEILGISRKTLLDKRKRYGLE
jgi:DNA-binding NtrC family response regulator